jgi:hypothetical protein
MELTRDQKIQTYHIWRRALTETRVTLTREYIKSHPGVITASPEWSDLLCIRETTIAQMLKE